MTTVPRRRKSKDPVTPIRAAPASVHFILDLVLAVSSFPFPFPFPCPYPVALPYRPPYPPASIILARDARRCATLPRGSTFSISTFSRSTTK